MSDPEVPAAHRRDRIVEMLRRQRGITVRDLAAQFGVTAMTIRRDLDALADLGLVIRVHGGAVAPVGARPASRSGPRRTIAMIVPDINYHWPAVTAAAQLEASERQVRMVVRLSRQYGRDTLDHVTRLLEHTMVDGLILAPYPSGPERTDLENWLAGRPLPAVYVDREPDDPSLVALHQVGVDNEAGGALAARHLVGLGHRRMIMVTDIAAPGAAARVRGWQQLLGLLGLPDLGVLPSVPLNHVDQDHHLDHTLATIAELEVTAAFVNGDPQAIALVQACHDHGVRVPEDLSIVGFDDELATLASPPLTTVRTPKETVGRTAVRLLLQAIADDAGPAQRIRYAPSLVVRESCAPGV